MSIKKLNLKKVVKVVAISSLLVGAGILAGCSKTYSQDDLNAVKTSSYDAGVTEGKSKVDITVDNAKAIADAKALEQASLGTPHVWQATPTETEREIFSPYTIDRLHLGDAVVDTLTNSNFGGLAKGIVEVDGRTVHYKEQLIFTDDVLVGVSGSSKFDSALGDKIALFDGRRDAIKDQIDFDRNFDWSKISEDEPMNIRILGKDFNIINADSATNEITVSIGNTVDMKRGQFYTLKDGTNITLMHVTDTAVEVSTEHASETIRDGKTRKVGNTYVTAKFVDGRNQEATIVVGNDVRKTFRDGDAFVGENQDSPNYIWDIGLNDNILGASYDKTLSNADEALTVGQFLEFPNKAFRLSLVQTTDEREESYRYGFTQVEIDNNLTKVLDIKGKLQYGPSNKDTNEIAWRDGVFYAYDSVSRNFVETPNVRFEVNKQALPSDLKIGNLAMDVDVDNHKFANLTYGVTNLNSRTDNVRALEGFVITNPKNTVESDNGVLVISHLPARLQEYGIKVESVPKQ